MISLRRRRLVRSSESGFSLAELVISVAIMGLLLGSVAMAMTTTVRIQASSKNQLTGAQAQTRLSYRAVSDIQSALAEGGVKTDTSSANFPDCRSPDAKLWLRSSDQSSGVAVLSETTFKLVGTHLIRVFCTATPPAEIFTVAQNVQSAVASISTYVVSGHTLVNRVAFVVTLNPTPGSSSSPLQFTSVATPRNLGIATIGSGDPPPPPPTMAACTVLPADVSWTTSNYPSMNPAAVVKIGRVTKRLKASVPFTAKTSGDCDPPYLLQRDFGLTSGTGFFTRTSLAPPQWLWELTATSPVDWVGTIDPADGTWEETVRLSPDNWAPLVLNDVPPPPSPPAPPGVDFLPADDANVGTQPANKFITAACHFDSLTVPSPITLNYRTKQPLAAVPIAVQGPALNYCDSASLYFGSGVVPSSSPDIPLTPAGSNWTGTIPVAFGAWSLTTDGGPAIKGKAAEGSSSNLDNESSPLGGFTSSITTNACKVISLTATADTPPAGSPLVLASPSSAGKLTNNVLFTATTAESPGPVVGNCGALRIDIFPSPGGVSAAQSSAMTRVPSTNTWRATFSKSLPGLGKWVTGLFSADVYFNGVCCANAASQSFTVTP